MKIKYLGTAAYEGIPSLFCNCETCRKSMMLGGRNIRSRSQAIINDDLLIDFPPDTVMHFHKYGIDSSKIRNCIITHSHSDHFYLEDIQMVRRDYCHAKDGYSITYHSGSSVFNSILEVKNNEKEKYSDMNVNLLEEGKTYKIGNYEVMPLLANHDPRSTPLIYAVSDGNKRILYANDTGLFFEKIWNDLIKLGHFDLVSLDCTGGLEKGWVEHHMCVETDMLIFNKMKELNLIDDSTIKVIHHFSHNGHSTYDELREYTKDLGIIVSYDGLEIKI